MNKRIRAAIVLSLVLIIVGMTVTAWAANEPNNAIPARINYQGYITNQVGEPIDGAITIEFRLYSTSSGVSALWTEIQSLTANKGIVNAELGGKPDPISTTIMDGERWLGVTVGTDSEMTPRKRLGSTPYSFYADEANNANTLDNMDSNAFATDAYVVALEARIADMEDFVNNTLAGVSRDGDTIIFSGINVQIDSGAGSTDEIVNGLGNLIVGYNELRSSGDDRTGSHNVIIGKEHNYSSYGGLVVGRSNSTTGPYASVSGGAYSTASGRYSSVSGGRYNVASGAAASVSGGGGSSSANGNQAFADYSSILGGYENLAGGTEMYDHSVGIQSTVVGGRLNKAYGSASCALGGYDNDAGGSRGVVVGGRQNATSGSYSTVSGGYYNEAAGQGGAVSGGNSNVASGLYSTVSGGYLRTSDGTYNWRAGTLLETQ